jgi:hypothetical protein
MDQDELQELIGLWAEGTLPESLLARTEAEIAKDPNAASDAASLRDTLGKLRSTSDERPDDWFVERALSRLLREHDDAQDERATAPTNSPEMLRLEL